MNWEYIKPKVSKKVFNYLLKFYSENGGLDRLDMRRILEKHKIEIRYSYGEPHLEEALIKWSKEYE